jgi:SPP1 family predicted phage head-tail adaptor
MDAGKMKYRITLQKPTVVSDAYGSKQDTTYVDYVTVFANKIDVGGNKMIANFELFTSKLFQFEIRYRTDVDETYRILHEGQYYEILSIKEKEYRKTLVFTVNLLQ